MNLPMNDDARLMQKGQEIPIKVFAQSSSEVYGPLDLDVHEGDIVSIEAMAVERVVSEVHRQRDFGMTFLRLVSKAEWRKQGANVNQTWNIGTAGAVAGRDIETANVVMSQLIQKIEESIRNDPTIPEEQKKSMLQKIGDAVLNPTVIEAAVAVLKGIFA